MNDLIIDENYAGLQFDGKKYILDGDLIYGGDIKITVPFVGTDSIHAGGDIKTGPSITASGETISDGDRISCRWTESEVWIECLGDIRANGVIRSGGRIFALGPISSGGDIIARGWIWAEGDIFAGGKIISPDKIHSYRSIWSGGDIIAGGEISHNGTINAKGKIISKADWFFDKNISRGYN